ncbi:hypothetical protein KIN20_001298 [Parelaphostrongylus tenuis]|nr:hypothetical protein KIN20_001298 [Parelaphostrongylus tenuis]
MVFTNALTAPTRFPGISTTSNAAKSFVSRLVMQRVTDVLEQQGRSAGLPDVILSNVLNQFTVQIEYDPFECKTVSAPDPGTTMVKGVMKEMLPNCIVVGGTVTALCTAENGVRPDMCDLTKNEKLEIIPSKHFSISGSLTTTNIIMANWSTLMWQNVVNRAVRMLASETCGQVVGAMRMMPLAQLDRTSSPLCNRLPRRRA